jgi:hypothetical protein
MKKYLPVVIKDQAPNVRKKARMIFMMFYHATGDQSIFKNLEAAH